MTGTVPVITFEAIRDVKMVRRGVFLFKLNSEFGWDVVVKKEVPAAQIPLNQREDSIVWASKVMKHAHNRSVNVKLLTPAEMRAIELQLDAQGFGVDDFPGLLPGVWTKMPYVPWLSSLEIQSEADEPGKVSLQAFITYFHRGTMWQGLGAITVADLFSGNDDRLIIEIDFAGQYRVGFANWGNLFVQEVGTRDMRLVGLDPFDPSGIMDASNVHTTVLPMPLKRRLDPLAREVDRNALTIAVIAGVARDVVAKMKDDSLPIFMSPFGPAFTVQMTRADVESSFMKFRPDFLRGFDAAVAALRAYLQKKDPKKLPPGILARKNHLNW